MQKATNELTYEVWDNVCIYLINDPPRDAGCETRSRCKGSKTGLNSELLYQSFKKTLYPTI